MLVNKTQQVNFQSTQLRRKTPLNPRREKARVEHRKDRKLGYK